MPDAQGALDAVSSVSDAGADSTGSSDAQTVPDAQGALDATGSGDAMGCTPGSTQCSGAVPQTCSSAGEWVSGAACSDICAAGTCVTVFDPASCEGPALTTTQAAALFQPGATSAQFGSYTVTFRAAQCNAVTGCGAPYTLTSWGDVAPPVAPNPAGTVTLSVNGTNVDVLLDAVTCAAVTGFPSAETSCGPVGAPLTCGAYQSPYYKLNDMSVDICTPPMTALVFSGTITPTCLRLDYKQVFDGAGSFEEAVVFATHP